MKVATYDLSKVITTINGVPISGFQEGDDATQVIPDGNDYEKEEGADGAIVRIVQNHPGGGITLSLMYSSLANQYLNGLRRLGKATGEAFHLMIQDLNGGTTTTAIGAWIKKAPDMSRGRSAGPLIWEIDAARVETDFMGIPGYDGLTI